MIESPRHSVKTILQPFYLEMDVFRIFGLINGD